MVKKKSKPADPRESNLQTAFNRCQRLNRAVRFSFVREICREMKCEHGEGESVFAAWLVAGKVSEAGEIGEVKIYFVKTL